jgi:hypothetical protein
MKAYPMIIRFAAAIFALCLIVPASAQQVPPYTYPITLGTASVSILPANPARKKLMFQNPNDSAKIAVCPIGPTRAAQGSPALIVAAINGAGCATLLPYMILDLTNGAAASGPPLSMGSAWVGIASAGGSALTIWEWE